MKAGRLIRMTDFHEFVKEQLEDPEFRAEYEALQTEYSLMQAMIDARRENGITQKELSKRTGISQSDISKFEGGGETRL